MKKGLIVLVVIILIVVALAASLIGTYNGLVSKREEIDGQLANVGTMLQRRADLIPNLVSCVQGYMSHEQSIIDSIVEARQSLLNAGSIKEKSEANEKLTDAIDALMVIVENYPDLKASENFINLQDELAGTENRIATARRDYNAAVKDYNASIKTFPNNIIAGMFNFDEADYFEVSEGSTEVPSVQFN